MNDADKRMYDVICLSCNEVIAKIQENRYIHLRSSDRRALIDTYRGTVTIKCRCGTGRVLHPMGKDGDSEKENLGVWLQEDTKGDVGESKNHSAGVSKPQ